MDRLIADTAERIFSDHVDRGVLDAAEHGEFPRALWDVVREAGLHLVGSPGSGTDGGDLCELLKVAGRHASPLPLAEVLMANSFLDEAGLTTIAVGGVAPWGRAADRVVTVEGEMSVDFDVAEDVNLAGESRDRVQMRNAHRVDLPGQLYERMALSRAALMVGALDRILAMAIDYATEREQFGRPIAKFQAVQHNLAILAGEVAAARCACDGAIMALGSPHLAVTVAAAKARVGEAAGVAAEIAHQVHGAMGFTHEHSLHHFTRRLWAWRDEYGRETHWQEQLGRRVAGGGADSVWEFLVGAG
ncbi:MAG: acyl-CoA dehydrogenase family protein [Gammaproteobacteria bacterium]|nr:acyl-CoA dehydrogenase family protein [Gammaproteobacteria bacterium]MDE0444543.1 acyl-CoA dehydrogenase family protein [Gammaproteobacteria bacterium]